MEVEIKKCTNYEYLDDVITRLDMSDVMLSDDIKGIRKNFLNKLKQKPENTHGNMSLSKASFRQILQILYRSMDFINNINEEIRREYRVRFQEELANIGFLSRFSSFLHLYPPPLDESISFTHTIDTTTTTTSPKTGTVASDIDSAHSPMPDPASPDPATDDPLVVEQEQVDSDCDSDGHSTVITKRKHKEIAEKVQNENESEGQGVNKKNKNKKSDVTLVPEDKIVKEINDSDCSATDDTVFKQVNKTDKSDGSEGEGEPDFSNIVIPSPPQTIKLIKKTPEQKEKENLSDSVQQNTNKRTSIEEELQNIVEAMKVPVPFKTEINEDVLAHPDLNENDLEIVDDEVPGGSGSSPNRNPSSKNASRKNQKSKNAKKKNQPDSTKEIPSQSQPQKPVVTKEDRRRVLRMLASSDEDEDKVQDKDKVEDDEEKRKKKEERSERKRAREEKKKSQLLVDTSGSQLCRKLSMKTQLMIPKFPKDWLKELKKKKYFYVHEPPPPASSSDESSSSEDDDEKVKRAIKDLKRLEKQTDFAKKKKSQPKKKDPVPEAKKRKGRKRKTSEVSVHLYSGSSSDSDVIVISPISNNRNHNRILSSESEGGDYLSGKEDSEDDTSFRKGFLDLSKKKKDDKKDTTDSSKKKKKQANLYVPRCAELYVNVSDSESDDELLRSRRPKRTRVIHSDSEDNGAPKIKKPRREVDKFSDDSDVDVVFQNTRTRTPKEKEVPPVPEKVEEAPLSISQTHSRKNIREIIDTSGLAKSTKVAQREEEDRKKRLAEKNKLMNAVSSAQQTVENLILDIDPKTKEPLVTVHPVLTQNLKDYQRNGVRFLWDSTIETVRKNKTKENGCILAHCMGLGKSIQTISYIHAVLNEDRLKLKTVLVVCPLTTVSNWQQEFKKWYQNVQNAPAVYDLSMNTAKTSLEKAESLQKWYSQGGVGIIHYNVFGILSHADSNQMKNRMKTTEEERKIFRETLINPGPDIIICDEGHRLKNEKNQLSKALAGVVSRRRIILTGTPLQNNLEEYYTMMNFVKPNFLGTIAEFRNRFVNPISNGQHKDSSADDVKLMKKRAHVLHKTLDSSVQRLDYQILMPMLPVKEEYVIHVTLSEFQMEFYDYYLKNVAKVDTKSQSKIKERALVKGMFLKDFNLLQKIQAHPMILYNQFEKAKKMARRKHPPVAENILANPLVEDISDDISESSDIEWLDDDLNKVEKYKAVNVKKEVIDTSEIEGEIIIPDLILPTTEPKEKEPTTTPAAEAEKKWLEDIVAKVNSEKDKAKKLFGFSGKFTVMRKILLECQKIGEKLVIFSSFTTTLDMIEKALVYMDEYDIGSWRKNKDYFRIDGSVKGSKRQILINKFNSPKGGVKLFIITKTSGGVGINLIGASRVIIFDCAWNPTDDQQSLYRVYRLGQVKPVFVYRLLSCGTMESKVYNRSVVKLSLSCRVVDEQQIERHFSNDDIFEMYKCNPKDKPRTEEIPLVPNDKVFANILVEHRNWIDSYFTHDSLLENKVDEGLSEEERKAAWDEFKTEQTRTTEILNSENIGNPLSQDLEQILNNNPNVVGPSGEGGLTVSKSLQAFQIEIDLIDAKLNKMDQNISNVSEMTVLEDRKARLRQLINSIAANGAIHLQWNQQQQPMSFQPQPQHMNMNMNNGNLNQHRPSPSKVRGNLSKNRAQAKKTPVNKRARPPPLTNLLNNPNMNQFNQFNDSQRGGPSTMNPLHRPQPPPLLTDDFASTKRKMGNFVAKPWDNVPSPIANSSKSFNSNPNPSPSLGLPRPQQMPPPAHIQMNHNPIFNFP